MISPKTLLASTLSDIPLLLETSTEALPSHNVSHVLQKRLFAYFDHRNDNNALQRLEAVTSESELELLTAQEALSIIQRVQAIVEVRAENGHDDPLLGTRDLARLRTLLSVAVRWGLLPVYTQASKFWIESRNKKDATPCDESYHLLSELTTAFFSLIFPEGAHGRISQTLITSSILSRHVSDFLLPGVALGWLPESMSRSSTPVTHTFRPFVVRLMQLYVSFVFPVGLIYLDLRVSPSQAISALAGIISSTPPLHVQNACTSLLTRQLLRPDGVDGLCRAMFSEEETAGDEIQLDKLEQIARILNSVPSSMESRVCLMLDNEVSILLKFRNTTPPYSPEFCMFSQEAPKRATDEQPHMLSIVLLCLKKWQRTQPKPPLQFIACFMNHFHMIPPLSRNPRIYQGPRWML